MNTKRFGAFVFVLCAFVPPAASAADEEKFFTSPSSAWEQFAVSPSAFDKAADAAIQGDESWLMWAQYRGLRRFNLLNPTPIGIAQSGVDVALDAAFRLGARDQEGMRKERYHLAKARHIYHQLLLFFPDAPEAKKAVVRIGELTERLKKLDTKLGNRELDETIFIRPLPRTIGWALVGDRPLRDLASLGTAAAFAGPMAPMMGGIFWTISAVQRGWALHDHGGLTPEEQGRELEFLAAEVRVLPYEKKQQGLETLAGAYEDEGTVRALAKAADIHSFLAEEYLESAEQHRENFKKSRERLADALLSYAEERGDAPTYEFVARDFFDTKAGKKAAEQLEKQESIKPQSPKLREAHINTGAGGSGFDMSGGGSSGKYKIDAGMLNGDPYGETVLPWNIRGIRGTPAVGVRGGPGRLSLFFAPDTHDTPSDIDLFE